MNIAVRKLSASTGDVPSTLVAYKLVGTEASIREYFCGSCTHGDPHEPSAQADVRQRSDWSALYTQFTMPHSINTVSYRFEVGYAYATLLRAEIDTSAFDVYLVDDGSSNEMADSSITGAIKAQRIKELLGIPADTLLMDEMGRRRALLICRETANEFELIIPQELVQDTTNSIFSREEIVSRFKPNSYLALARRQDGDSGDWYTFDYTDVEKMDNRPPNFIANLMTNKA